MADELKLFFIFLGMLAGVVAVQVVYAVDDDVYGESALPSFDAAEVVPEQNIVLPPYPQTDALQPIDVDPKGSSFSFMIDPASISVGADRIIRYTVLMRSSAGVENVVYEGLRCDRRQYRRYAYGSDGVFQPVADSKWKFIRKIPRDRYRAVLLEKYFCPLPRADGAEKIRKKLQRGGVRRSIDAFE